MTTWFIFELEKSEIIKDKKKSANCIAQFISSAFKSPHFSQDTMYEQLFVTHLQPYLIKGIGSIKCTIDLGKQ